MYGIIGYPLLHTFSPAYFNTKFEKEGIAEFYNKFPMASVDGLKPLLAAQPELRGLSVTIPHKQAVMPLLDELDDTAREIGAVNTIRIKEGKLKGYNTDTIGFTRSLQPLLQPQHTRALILGTGGAAKAVAYSLQQLGISFQYVSRNAAEGQLDYADLREEIITTHKLIINATPLGMAPDTAACPAIPYDLLGPDYLLYDLIYIPEETLFLKKGKEQGTIIKNGYEMLIAQAEATWEIWNT